MKTDADVRTEINGTLFVWNAEWPRAGLDWIGATSALHDPLLAPLQEPGWWIGWGMGERPLMAVQVAVEGELVRILSARRATDQEKAQYDR